MGNLVQKIVTKQVLKTASEGPTTLVVCDFDGTLFRSPTKDQIDDLVRGQGLAWSGGFWGRPESLGPTVPADPLSGLVPQHPGQEWWIERTVSAMRALLQNPENLCVLITGRPPTMASRIKELLSQQGLNFARVHTVSSKENKPTVVKEYLRDYPSIKKVESWDDRDHENIKTALHDYPHVQWAPILVEATPGTPDSKAIQNILSKQHAKAQQAEPQKPKRESAPRPEKPAFTVLVDGVTVNRIPHQGGAISFAKTQAKLNNTVEVQSPEGTVILRIINGVE